MNIVEFLIGRHLTFDFILQTNSLFLLLMNLWMSFTENSFLSDISDAQKFQTQRNGTTTIPIREREWKTRILLRIRHLLHFFYCSCTTSVMQSNFGLTNARSVIKTKCYLPLNSKSFLCIADNQNHVQIILNREERKKESKRGFHFLLSWANK